MKYRRSVVLNVRCLKCFRDFRSRDLWFRIKSKGASSNKFISSLDLRIIVVRLPHEKIAANNPAISISCFLLNRCGTEMGSAGIKDGLLNTRTFFSRKFLSSFLFFNLFVLTDRLIQIFYQVTRIFDTHADSDQ